MELIICALAGLLGGIVSGMGIGGGVVMIPILTLLLKIPQHTAQGINLIYFIPTAATALFLHIKEDRADVSAGWRMAAFGIIGSIAGAVVAGFLPTNILKRIFAVFLLFLGGWQLWQAIKKE